MTIQQTITIKSSPDKIYNALISAKEFAELTGAPAEIAADEGGAFSMFGGQITGRHLEFIPNKRIVQEWRAGPWPEGINSKVTFEIEGSADSSTITVEHSGFPDGAEDDLDGGWHKMYWEPLKAHLE